MKLINIIKHATDFGTFRSRGHFLSFALKCIFYIIPAVVLGNFTDIVVKKIKKDEGLGTMCFTIFYYKLL